MKKISMKFRQTLILGMLVLLMSTFVSVATCAAALDGEAYYTKTNIWYEDAGKPIAVNYHRGTMIPIGTKVTIVFCENEKIKFTTESGVTLVFWNAPKYSTISLQELFDRSFSKGNILTDPTRVYHKLSQKEKDYIKQGTVEPGMCKVAVLMAYGYPPSHRTPDIKSDTWSYWDGRFSSFRVVFRNNRVASIETGRPRRTN
jgi:hypothetical protein